jgi:hypothetical protein
MAKIRRNVETENEEGLTLTQLATRIPKELHKTVKVWCVNHDTSVADFTTDALRHELEARRAEDREAGRAEKTKAKKPVKKKKGVRHFDEEEDYIPDDEDAA